MSKPLSDYGWVSDACRKVQAAIERIDAGGPLFILPVNPHTHTPCRFVRQDRESEREDVWAGIRSKRKR